MKVLILFYYHWYKSYFGNQMQYTCKVMYDVLFVLVVVNSIWQVICPKKYIVILHKWAECQVVMTFCLVVDTCGWSKLFTLLSLNWSLWYTGRSKVNSTDDWGIENTPASVVKIGAATLYSAISSQRNEKDKPVYWVASQEYLGKKVCYFWSY